MTFAAIETSAESGQPIELYEFRVGTDFYRLTSNDVDVTYLASVYTAIQIVRGKITSTADSRQDKLDVELPANHPLVTQFILYPPGKNTTLTLRKYHRSDPDLQVVTIYRGAIQGVDFVDGGRKAQLRVTPATSALSRQVPRFTYQNLCNHMLYDTRCKILELDARFSKMLPVTAAVGNVITVTGAGAFGFTDFFEGGFVAFSGDYRMVVRQATDDLELLLPFSVSPVGQTVRCQAGCKGRISTDCLTKFDNVPNFGGYPYVPKKNPFTTGLD